MKKFIGKRVEFFVEGIGLFQAKVVGDLRDMVLVKGDKDEFARRIIKGKICAFMPLEPVDDDEASMLVLMCENPTIRCPGVQFVKEGGGFSQNDFKAFMGPCPRRCETCWSGSLGELKAVDGAKLCEMMAGTMFGDYPEAKGDAGA